MSNFNFGCLFSGRCGCNSCRRNNRWDDRHDDRREHHRDDRHDDRRDDRCDRCGDNRRDDNRR